MHLADGTLANQVCTATAIASATGLVYAASRARAHATPRTLARAGVGAAIVLVAQMIDVPLFGAVPVHVVGAAFLVALSGPALALLAMTLVLVAQALALHDGGVTALGANVFNMGVVGVAVASFCMDSVNARIGGRAGRLVGVALASAASMSAAVVAVAAELALSGVSREVFAAAIAAHAPFAAFETVMTVAVVAALANARVFAGEPGVERAGK